jgi:hypothetical protein
MSQLLEIFILFLIWKNHKKDAASKIRQINYMWFLLLDAGQYIEPFLLFFVYVWLDSTKDTEL